MEISIGRVALGIRIRIFAWMRPGPAFHFHADPDPHKSEENLRPLLYRPSDTILRLQAFIAIVHFHLFWALKLLIFYLNADPDPACKINADPDPATLSTICVNPHISFSVFRPTPRCVDESTRNSLRGTTPGRPSTSRNSNSTSTTTGWWAAARA